MFCSKCCRVRTLWDEIWRQITFKRMLFIGLIFTETLKGLAQDHTSSQGQCPFLMAQWRKGKKVGVEVEKCYQRQSTVAVSRFHKCLRRGSPTINRGSCLRAVEIPNTIVLILSFHPPPPPHPCLPASDTLLLLLAISPTISLSFFIPSFNFILEVLANAKT